MLEFATATALPSAAAGQREWVPARSRARVGIRVRSDLMSHHRSAGRVFALGFAITLLLSAALPMAALAKRPQTASLGLHDEQLLSSAIAEGRTQVTILVAAKGGEANAAASAITAAGGTINYRDNALGYLRATVATGTVRQIAAQPAIQAVDLD